MSKICPYCGWGGVHHAANCSGSSRQVTLANARQRIGLAVIHRQIGLQAEQGVVTSVNDRFVFVRYGADMTSKATEPSALEWLAEPDPSDQSSTPTKEDG